MFIIVRNRDFCLAPVNSILFDDMFQQQHNMASKLLTFKLRTFRHLCRANLLHYTFMTSGIGELSHSVEM